MSADRTGGAGSSSGAPAVLWFRRDLRLGDNPALLAATEGDRPVAALFTLDDTLLRPAGAARTAFLLRSVRALEQALVERGGSLTVRRGPPERVLPRFAGEIGAEEVHISADYGPYGAARDQRVRQALGNVALISTGSPYAVAPHRVHKSDGTGYRVFTPYFRAWQEHGWLAPARSSDRAVKWLTTTSEALPTEPPVNAELPAAGEAAAMAAWQAFRRDRLSDYPESRDRPDLDATSRMSPHLKLGTIHPRTMLANLSSADSAFRRQLAWREFYAAVLHFWPDSARDYFKPDLAAMRYDSGPAADQQFRAWADGRTGYPIVDAGMRQLLAEGWMHNRLRMMTASFLVKDLHQEWTRGARHFMAHLIDADLASNQHGWQWTAGTGTDAAPYFRIFNPITQGRRFDPDGDYIRRWVPELRELTAPHIHEPWLAPGGIPRGYHDPIVDHGRERKESLARYHHMKG
jgi:deoxyribodipyrimidine photo-lyase